MYFAFSDFPCLLNMSTIILCAHVNFQHMPHVLKFASKLLCLPAFGHSSLIHFCFLLLSCCWCSLFAFNVLGCQHLWVLTNLPLLCLFVGKAFVAINISNFILKDWYPHSPSQLLLNFFFLEFFDVCGMMYWVVKWMFDSGLCLRLVRRRCSLWLVIGDWVNADNMNSGFDLVFLYFCHLHQALWFHFCLVVVKWLSWVRLVLY